MHVAGGVDLADLRVAAGARLGAGRRAVVGTQPVGAQLGLACVAMTLPLKVAICCLSCTSSASASMSMGSSGSVANPPIGSCSPPVAGALLAAFGLVAGLEGLAAGICASAAAAGVAAANPPGTPASASMPASANPPARRRPVRANNGRRAAFSSYVAAILCPLTL
jgi:hypothetical protein